MDDPYPSLIFGLFALLLAAVLSAMMWVLTASQWWQAKHLKVAQSLNERILTYFSRHLLRLVLTIKTAHYAALGAAVLAFMQTANQWLQITLAPVHDSLDIFLLGLMALLLAFVYVAFSSLAIRGFSEYAPNDFMNWAALPLYTLYLVLYPVVELMRRWVLLQNKQNISPESKLAPLAVGLHTWAMPLLSAQNDTTQNSLSVQIYRNALELPTLRVRDCMIPRTEIAAIDKNNDVEALAQKFIETGYSKILVYEESIDNIVGYCHSSELFKKPKSIDQILTTVPSVPETMSAEDLLLFFNKEHRSIAVVIDEFGGTAGLICIEDVMEEIFGEIKDEHDEDTLEEKALAENMYLLNARLEVYYLNQKYDWQIPEGDYETLGGYILSIYENIPDVGTVVEAPPFSFKILGKTDARLHLVEMTIL
ncbi:Hemolysin, contains CBS domains [Flexibacter flexilis DSM 6793]|uniref:Hemolysin, contains CBS domains n=1 Tax=Flexibacter flexilis DSM 6793 TaxID=927664 RepID=A0A1I1LNE6_9BACT|nr:hemolysin family protein [Flexibacter flexilis]SFC74581.1 Hemolysin, contains CBS domains [Flexibacter flexilis DSM 6793]